MTERFFPILALLLALPFSLHAKEAAPDWKAQVKAGVEAWDANRAEEAEKVLKAAVAAAEKIKNLPLDTELALAHQILSRLCETRGKGRTKKKDAKKEQAEADRHFQKARGILDKAWATGAGEKVLSPFNTRAAERSAKYSLEEAASLRRLAVEVLEVRAPGTAKLAIAYDEYACALWALGLFLEAEGLNRRSLALYEKLRDPKAASNTLQDLATCYCLQGRYREAVDLYQRILTELENRKPVPGWALAICLSHLAHAAVQLGDETQAEAMCQRALPLLEKLAELETEAAKADPSLQKKAGYGEKQLMFSRLLTWWGDLRRSQGRFEEAMALYTRALNSGRGGEAGVSIAALYQVQGHLSDAERIAREIVKGTEQVIGSDSFHVAPFRTLLASICLAAGKDKEAEALLRKSLKVQEEVLGSQHPDAAETADILGTLLYARGAYEEAEALFESALEGRIQAFGEAHALVSETLGHQGDLYMTMGRPKDAEAPYRKALALDEKRLGENHSGVGLQCRCLGQSLLAQGRSEEAEPYLSRALRIDEGVFGAEHPALDQDLDSLSKLFKAKGDSGKQAEMEQRLEAGRAKAAEEASKPVAPAEPLIEVPATPEGLQGALRRGLGYLAEARGAAALDFDTKRRAYTDAEAAFAQAMKALETMKAAGTAPDDPDGQAAQIRTFLFECHKCKPLPAGK